MLTFFPVSVDKMAAVGRFVLNIYTCSSHLGVGLVLTAGLVSGVNNMFTNNREKTLA